MKVNLIKNKKFKLEGLYKDKFYDNFLLVIKTKKITLNCFQDTSGGCFQITAFTNN